MSLRAKLREALSERLVPELKRRGFTGPDKISGNTILHQFTRAKAEGFEKLSIQFDKWQRPRFVLNVSLEPSDGIKGLIKRGEPCIQGRITQRVGITTRSWFCADRPWWQRLAGIRSSLEDEAVRQALLRLDAIDDWFKNPRKTKVVRLIMMPPRRNNLAANPNPS